MAEMMLGKIEIINNFYRPCIVKFDGKECRAIFHMFAENAEIVPPSYMQGGHSGGVVKGVIAVVEIENGEIMEVDPHRITFLDTHHLFMELAEYFDKHDAQKESNQD